jgi:serine/threonine-protein kinase RsbW
MKIPVKRNVAKKQHKKDVFVMVCKSNPREIACIENFLLQIKAKLNFNENILHRLLVSCTEAVNNAITHGNKCDLSKKVNIKCIADKRMLKILVKDEGEGFDPGSLEDPREEKNLLKEYGRGVFLIKSLMDEFSVRHLKSGTVVEMKIKLN